MADDRVVLGVIGSPHGLKGEVKLKSFTTAPEAIALYGPLEAGVSGRQLRITRLKPMGSGFIAQIEGIEDRTAAEQLKGLKLHIRRNQLPEPEPGMYYHTDLVGMEVRTVEGQVLGRVVSVENYGAGDLLQVKRNESSETVLVPVLGAQVNLSVGVITVTLAEGLLKEN